MYPFSKYEIAFASYDREYGVNLYTYNVYKRVLWFYVPVYCISGTSSEACKAACQEWIEKQIKKR